jgi:hypothetical protein
MFHYANAGIFKCSVRKKVEIQFFKAMCFESSEIELAESTNTCTGSC